MWTPLYGAIAYGTGRMVAKGRPEERGELLALVRKATTVDAAWVGFATALNASIWRRNR